MAVELSSDTEAQLRRLADEQGRDVRTLVEEAVRQYLDATAITDLSPEQVGDLQMRLAEEATGIEPWSTDDGVNGNAAR